MDRVGRARASVCVLLFCALVFLRIGVAAAGGPRVENKTAAAATSPSADVHPVLVELFTSEGCSSCPPADALLERMDASQTIAGAQLIVLSEHVDYWDHDGWKDPNSSAALTERQDSYVRALGLKTPYTPQIIVDGTGEVHANNPEQFGKVFQQAAAVAKVPVRISDFNIDAGNPPVLRARIEADGNSAQHDADIYLAVALNRVESQVLHGENGGRHLTHVAVVQQLTKVGKLPKGGNFGETIQLKLKPGTDPKNVRIVAFVQEPGPGRLVGAALLKPATGVQSDPVRHD